MITTKRRNHKKGVPQTAKISKQERISSKSPSQLGFVGEQLFWGTARGVLFFTISKDQIFKIRHNKLLQYLQHQRRYNIYNNKYLLTNTRLVRFLFDQPLVQNSCNRFNAYEKRIKPFRLKLSSHDIMINEVAIKHESLAKHQFQL